MSTPEPVGPPAQTAAMTTLTAEIGATPYPVDSRTRDCREQDCSLLAPVNLPHGYSIAGQWQVGDDGQPYRMVQTAAGSTGVQRLDGSIDVAPPAGADLVGRWEDTTDGQQPYRSVFGRDRLVTDSEVRVYAFAIQLADGSTDLFADPGGVNVAYGESIGLGQLNSDQARELAAALLECAAELDGWVAG